MSDILQRAKARQLASATDTHIMIKLSFLQELIAEIERLEVELDAEIQNRIEHRPTNVKPLKGA
jgi:hypothetical protein